MQQSHQLLWAYEDVQRGVPELVARLKEAQAWAHKANILISFHLMSSTACISWRLPGKSTFHSCLTYPTMASNWGMHLKNHAFFA